MMSAKVCSNVPANESHVIKVIGVGDAGSNAVEQMIREHVGGVEFLCCNTDAQAMQSSSARVRLQLGPGLSADGVPRTGRAYALAARDRITEALRGAEMVFIVAGMGGGTGTGASPIIAEIARSLGIFTLAVITLPFDNEGQRLPLADAGAADLARIVDCPIVIHNEKVAELIGAGTDISNALRASDDAICSAVKAIAEMVNAPGLMNADLNDVKTAMGNRDRYLKMKTLIGSGVAAGVGRVQVAVDRAVNSPLLGSNPLAVASSVLLNITANDGLCLKELRETMNVFRQYIHPQAIMVVGAVFDDRLGDQLRVTVIACGTGLPGWAQSHAS